MKRRDLVAELQRAGCVLLRNGAKRDIYHDGARAGSSREQRISDKEDIEVVDAAGAGRMAQPAVKANAPAWAAIIDRPPALDRTALFDEYGSPFQRVWLTCDLGRGSDDCLHHEA